MRVTVDITGGLAGIGAPPHVIDDRTLPPEAAAYLTRLVAAAKVARPNRAGVTYFDADGYCYTVTLDDGGPLVTLHGADGDMTPDFRVLLDWLNRHTD